ncbi:MAG: trehalose-phosphatase [Sphingomonadaceae bacterium]|nr:trehalose-phosphatase [Sphingomonadaceae bacterium]
MSHPTILAPPPSLASLCEEKEVALFLDFDGTLVDIAPRPDAIKVPAGMCGSLRSLSARLDGRLAIVSGRSLDDLGQHLDLSGMARAGSHGDMRVSADGSVIGDEPEPLTQFVMRDLTEFAQRHGLLLERKPHGAALHYRDNLQFERAVSRFAGLLAEQYGLATKAGKCVVELVPRGDGKAGAVATFMAAEPFIGARPIFIGDDVTDEDGFRAASEFGGFGIAVGERVSDNAQFHLADISAVHSWLELDF